MQEIAMHGLAAEIDYKNLLQSLANQDTRQTRIVWSYLTSFLAHAAMISKYLSPINPRGLTKERMVLLREKLHIEDDSDVLPRDARDNVEHFDERIDNWVGDNVDEILEIVLDGRHGYNYLQADASRVKRILLQDEMIFISEKRDGGKFELSLQPLFKEVKRIGNEAEAWIDDSSPYHFLFPR